MTKLKVIEGIGEINEKGVVVNKCLYQGEKGFKVVENETHKFVYLLNKQEKLFTIPNEVNLQYNENAIVIPIMYAKEYLVNHTKLSVADDMLGVFNTLGELLNICKQVKLDYDYYQAADEKKSFPTSWGLYSYDGEEIFPKIYEQINCVKCKIDGSEEIIFRVVLSGMNALFSSDKRKIIPFDFHYIDMFQLSSTSCQFFITFPHSSKKRNINLKRDREGKVIALY